MRILSGRPEENFSPPIGLYHQVFDEFRKQLVSNDEIPVEVMREVHALSSTSTEFYSSERDRWEQVRALPEPFLGSISLAETGGCECDGVLTEGGGHPAFIEIKNEIGMSGSDPVAQVGYAYAKFVSADNSELKIKSIVSSQLRLKCTVTKLRRASYCPSILIAIAGPWLCVLGAIFTDKVVVQPLTSFVWLGWNVFGESLRAEACRVLYSLKKTIPLLRQYYRSEFDSDMFPYVTSYKTSSMEI